MKLQFHPDELGHCLVITPESEYEQGVIQSVELGTQAVFLARAVRNERSGCYEPSADPKASLVFTLRDVRPTDVKEPATAEEPVAVPKEVTAPAPEAVLPVPSAQVPDPTAIEGEHGPGA